jgi:protein gp37
VEYSDYKYRIEDLRKTDAKVKFLSCEPLLGDLGKLDLTEIDWVIVGGESGPHARPMHPDWVRNIQKQCAQQNIPFFFKQWGEWNIYINELPFPTLYPAKKSGGNERNKEGFEVRIMGIEWDWCDEFCCTVPYDEQTKLVIMQKVGKKKAGCLLDGKTYKEYPKVGE